VSGGVLRQRGARSAESERLIDGYGNRTEEVHMTSEGDGEHAQFDPAQRREVLDLVEAMPWGDMEGAIRTMEESLRLGGGQGLSEERARSTVCGGWSRRGIPR
jgi:hypothetical protein